MLKVVLFYEEIKEDFEFSSSSRLIEFKKIINDKHVPLDSQILSLIDSA